VTECSNSMQPATGVEKEDREKISSGTSVSLMIKCTMLGVLCSLLQDIPSGEGG
jgi:hypothetical protein